MGRSFKLYALIHLELSILLTYILYTSIFLPGPCMFSEDSLGCCSTMCLSTAHPAARPLWQRTAVCWLGQGSVASGAEAAACPGSLAWLMEASYLTHSVPLNQARKPVKPLHILYALFCIRPSFLWLIKFHILHHCIVVCYRI